MKILFLPNWRVAFLESDNPKIQAPDKYVKDKPYWFFQHFNMPCEVDVIDIQQGNPLSLLERKCNTYLWQGIKAFFNDSKYDLVISHGAQSGLMYSLLRTLSFRKRPKHVIFDIGGMNGGRNNRYENFLINLALQSKPYIVCHSRVIIENYKKNYKSLVDRSCFIPFGVDVDDFLPRDSTDQNYILSFGASKRDYPTLLSAWAGIDTDIKLRLIGYIGDVSLLNVETVAKVSIEELRNQIAKALFVVIPLPVFNYSYGQMSFLQSMSMGKTVIVTLTPSSIDYLQDGEGSLFVKPYDVDDMKLKIKMLINDPQLLENLNGKARQYVVKNNSEKNMAIEIERFIESCV